jgi:hypothetical protein
MAYKDLFIYTYIHTLMKILQYTIFFVLLERDDKKKFVLKPSPTTTWCFPFESCLMLKKKCSYYSKVFLLSPLFYKNFPYILLHCLLVYCCCRTLGWCLWYMCFPVSNSEVFHCVIKKYVLFLFKPDCRYLKSGRCHIQIIRDQTQISTHKLLTVLLSVGESCEDCSK